MNKEKLFLNTIINTIKNLPHFMDKQPHNMYENSYKEEVFLSMFEELKKLDRTIDIKKLGRLCGIKNKKLLNPDDYIMVMGIYIERVNDCQGNYLIGCDEVLILDTNEKGFVEKIENKNKKIQVAIKTDLARDLPIFKIQKNNKEHIKDVIYIDAKKVKKIGAREDVDNIIISKNRINIKLPTKVSGKKEENIQKRVSIINALINKISSLDRRFFYKESTERTAYIVYKNKRLYLIDEWTNQPCYLHSRYNKPSKNFNQGGTMWALVMDFKNFILTGQKSNGKNGYGGLYCKHWGYSEEDMKIIIDYAKEIGYL